MREDTALVSRSDAGSPHWVANEVTGLQVVMVNVFLVGDASRSWVLVDAGLAGSAGRIRRAAEERFGVNARPSAILLTHGHFDHVGALEELARRWDVPIYAHRLEMPFLNGRSEYPPPDPTVGGGSMAWLSPLYPRGPIDVSARLRELPADGTVPGLPGWRWLHTPGHTAGHVSFFRDADRTLIAGDAVITTKQESLLAVLSQRIEVHGPPAYYTQDWGSARQSVEKLAALRPEVLACGHGLPLGGEEAARELDRLAREFDEREVPSDGRYVRRPALTNENGIVFLPPPVGSVVPPTVVAGIAVGALGYWLYTRMNREPASDRQARSGKSEVNP